MDGHALAVPLAGRGVGRVQIVVVDGQGRYEPGALSDHLCNLRVGELETMLDGVAAAVQGALQTDSVVGVAGDSSPPTVRLVDDRPELLHRQRRLRNECALLIDPRPVRHVYLDPVGTMIELLARRLAGLHRAVNDLSPLGHLDFGRIAFEDIAAGRRDRAG